MSAKTENAKQETADLKAVTKQLKSAQAQLVNLGNGLLSRGLVSAESLAQDGFDPASTALSALDVQAAEIKSVRGSLSAQKGATTRAKNELVETESRLRDAEEPARDVAPLQGKAAERPLKADELLELIDDAESVEIVASDGKKEALGAAPLMIRGGRAAFRKSGRGLHLNVPKFTVHGPAMGRSPYPIAGYGLMIDGEMAAWSQRHEQLQVGPGQTMNLAADVVF